MNTYNVVDQRLDLKQIFSESYYPYHFNMSVILSNIGEESFSAFPKDSLILVLGSGLWQKESGQHEIKQSVRYYVKPVALINGRLRKQITDNQEAGVLSWESKELHWIGFHSNYFALLILPNKNDTIVTLPFSQIFINSNSINPDEKKSVHDFQVLYCQLPVSSIEPGEKVIWNFTFFSGPKSYEAIREGPENLKSLLFSDLWVGMRWLCLVLYYSLIKIHYFIPYWGWSIILFALLVRIILYPLGKKAQKSQNRFIEGQKKILPELNEIKKTYKGGEQSEQILLLYKKYNFSPFAGLKPLLVVLIQLPILIALFHVLGRAYELCDARFLWIDSLAEPDNLFSFGFNIPLLGSNFNFLPVLMAFFTLLSFKLAPAPTAEKKEQRLQNIFLIVMTLTFFFLFYSFPAGMVLYWTFANVFHIVQHKIMFRKLKG